jgi:hypothetical protein
VIKSTPITTSPIELVRAPRNESQPLRSSYLKQTFSRCVGATSSSRHSLKFGTVGERCRVTLALHLEQPERSIHHGRVGSGLSVGSDQ